MDQYIYKPPPPPPPPGGGQSGGRGVPGKERGAPRNGSQRHKPYQRPPNKSSEDPVLIPPVQIPRTPDEIAKWIEERRKNWPSARRVAEKEEEKSKKATEPSSSKFEQSQPLPSTDTVVDTPKAGICKFFMKGKCRHGDKCKHAHPGGGGGNGGSSRALPKRFEAPNAKESLYKRLVQVDVDTQDVQVLSFITFLRNKGVI